MIFTMDTGETVNTVSLSPEERHIIQKLLAWHSLVDSMSQFQEKTRDALRVGWNNSGPVHESRALSLVIRHLETRLRNRLAESP